MGFPPSVVALLDAPLEKERVAKRAGSGGMQLSYLEGYDVIDAANRIFGYDGWEYHAQAPVEYGDGIIGTRVTTRVRPNPDDTATWIERTDIGVGTGASNANGKEKALKEAVTDGLKRALRAYGSQFGNSLYDKHSDLHNVDAATAVKTPKPTSKTIAPATTTSEFNCEQCSAEIKGSVNYSAAELVQISKDKTGGKVLCYNCRNGK